MFVIGDGRSVIPEDHNVIENTRTLFPEHLIELGWRHQVEGGLTISFKLHQLTRIEELHAQAVIVSEYWSKRLEPLNTKHDIGIGDGRM